MKLEAFLVSDAATVDDSGKLNILGAFDAVNAKALPIVIPQLSISLRLRYEKNEIGTHTIKIKIRSPKNKELLIADMEFSMSPKKGVDTGSFSLIVGAQNLTCEEIGYHIIEAKLDNEDLGTIGFSVLKVD